MAKAADDTNILNEYLHSRDAVALLLKNQDLRTLLSRPEADFLTRFPNFYTSNSIEGLIRHFQRFVDVSLQSSSGIGLVRVSAFRPEDAERITRALLLYGEELVNRLNDRARSDAIKFASSIVEEAEQRYAHAQQSITDFRNRSMVLDPNKQSLAALELVSSLTSTLARERAALAQVLAMAPNSPQLPSIRTRIHALEAQISQQRGLVVGSDTAFASQLSEYEKLILERELSVKALTSALTSLETARQEAQRQQLYLERISEPNRPDQFTYPRRWLIMGGMTAFVICVYVLLRKFGRATAAHHL
jgi:capsular polysaccharide transport system permease protein